MCVYNTVPYTHTLVCTQTYIVVHTHAKEALLKNALIGGE